MAQDDDRFHSNLFTATDTGRVKIFFAFDDDGSTQTETMWAKPIGDGVFLLDSVPFFAYGVSCGDKLYAQRASDGALEFAGVAESGGHSTYRVMVAADTPTSVTNRYWLELERLGCGRERASEQLWAIDLPPQADIQRAHEVLERGEAAGVWDFEEAHVGHGLRG
jgi:hypothetical protein